MTRLPHGRQRARSDSEKALRRAELLASAERLLDRGDYETATMSAIAADAGISKPSAYLYFRTKEALFLALLTEQLQAWFRHVASALDAQRQTTRQDLARIIAGSLADRSTLRSLLLHLHVSFEHKIGIDDATAFKKAMAEGMGRLGTRMEQAVDLSAGSGVKFLMLAHALCLGLTQVAALSPVVRDAVRSDPALAFFQVDFRQAFERALCDLLLSARRNAVTEGPV